MKNQRRFLVEDLRPPPVFIEAFSIILLKFFFCLLLVFSYCISWITYVRHINLRTIGCGK